MAWGRFPFARYTVALIAGIAAFLYFDQTPRFLIGVLVASAVATAFFAIIRQNPDSRFRKTILGISALLFLTVAGWLLAAEHIAQSPTDFWHVQSIEAYEGVVISSPEHRPRSFKAILEVQKIKTSKGWQPANGKIQAYFPTAIPRPLYGDRLLFTGTPQRVEPPHNPGELDYRRFLSYQHIFYQQYISAENFVKVGNDPPNRLLAFSYKVNRAADSVITAYLGQRREYGVAKAMLLGIRDDLDPDVMQSYSASGAIHILSVSGLHVAILFIVLGYALGWLKRWAWGKYLYVSIMLLILWAYAVLTGLSAPVLRSAGMITFLLIRELLKRPPSTYNTLFASAFFLLLIDPFMLASVGFQLSYLAVLGIVYLQPRVVNWLPKAREFPTYHPFRWLWEGTATALAAQLATFPLSIYYFHQFPLYFLLSNPAVMLISTVAQPLGLALMVFYKIPGLVDILAKLTQGAFFLLNETAVLTERLPHATWSFLHFSAGETMGFYALIIGVLALFYTRKKGFAFLSLTLALGLSGWSVWQKINQSHQQLIVIHHVRNHSVVSLIEGATLTVLTDSAMASNPLDLTYSCMGLWAERGVRQKMIQNLTQFTIQSAGKEIHGDVSWVKVWKGKTLGSVEPTTKKSRLSATIPFDYFILGRNAADGQKRRLPLLPDTEFWMEPRVRGTLHIGPLKLFRLTEPLNKGHLSILSEFNAFWKQVCCANR